MNPLVFNTVCQMFQLVCILLQAIACCTKAVVLILLRAQKKGVESMKNFTFF